MTVISGFLNTTLLDYPGMVATTVFMGGCNFRCPFCHNADLVINPERKYDENEILTFLKKRKGIIDGVCITGGEPTLQKDLLEFVYRIKNLGLKVKLDTNGTNPKVVEQLYEGNLIDYVAMDIKNSEENYFLAAGIDDTEALNVKYNIMKTISFLMNSGIEYEFRTTLVKGIHTYNDMDEIGKMIKGAKAYYLQSYKAGDNIIAKNTNGINCETFSDEELKEFLKRANMFSNAYLRGVE